jgi:hypothetical protein
MRGLFLTPYVAPGPTSTWCLRHLDSSVDSRLRTVIHRYLELRCDKPREIPVAQGFTIRHLLIFHLYKRSGWLLVDEPSDYRSDTRFQLACSAATNHEQCTES